MSKVKICGLSRMEDIETVNSVLPDYIGFVFAPSKRKVDTKTAAKLKSELDPRIKAVGVFVNEAVDIVAEICQKKVIDFVQLHGDEDGKYIEQLRSICNCGIIKTVCVSAKNDVNIDLDGNRDRTDVYNNSTGVINEAECSIGISIPFLSGGPEYLLFDTLSNQRGGAGMTFDWSILKQFCGLPYFLAGGLTAKNVEAAIELLNPYCVDVSSGVETDGVKDAGKIYEFIHKVRKFAI